MNGQVVAAALVLNLLIALFVLGRVIQQSERSRFRYAMWGVRDDVVDAVLNGRLSPDDSLFRYIDRLELAVRFTDLLTPFQLAVTLAAMSRAGRSPQPSPAYSPLLEEDRVLFDEFRRRATAAQVRLFFAGSPSGWVLTLLSPLLALLLRTSGKDRPQSIVVVADWSRSRFGSSTDILRPRVQSHTDSVPPAYV